MRHRLRLAVIVLPLLTLACYLPFLISESIEESPPQLEEQQSEPPILILPTFTPSATYTLPPTGTPIATATLVPTNTSLPISTIEVTSIPLEAQATLPIATVPVTIVPLQ